MRGSKFKHFDRLTYDLCTKSCVYPLNKSIFELMQLQKLLPILFCLLFRPVFSQNEQKDTLFLMNGRIVATTVLDTSLGAATVVDPKKPEKKLNYEYDRLYGIKYAKTGSMYYYYFQDTLQGNDFTRDEMWLFMKGEQDAKKGFKARGSFFGSMAAGLIGGASGQLYGPIAPSAYLLLCGLPKVRIRHNTISNPYYIDSDAYILGYEREARSKRRIQCLLGGGLGMVLGYLSYFAIIRPSGIF